MKKATSDIERRTCSQESDVPHTNSSMYFFSVTQALSLLGFSWSPDNITANNKKSTFKKELSSVSEMTMQHLHKNIIIPLLCQCELFIQHVCLRIQLYQIVIFYLLWYKVIRWSSHIRKKLLFSDFIVCKWSLVNNTGEVLE